MACPLAGKDRVDEHHPPAAPDTPSSTGPGKARPAAGRSVGRLQRRRGDRRHLGRRGRVIHRARRVRPGLHRRDGLGAGHPVAVPSQDARGTRAQGAPAHRGVVLRPRGLRRLRVGAVPADREAAEPSTLGIAIAALSLVVMPVLSWAQRRTGRQLGSPTVVADSKQTLLCTYLSAVLLAGLLLNSLLGWWWADPLVGLVVAALAVREGLEAWRGETCGCIPTTGRRRRMRLRGPCRDVTTLPVSILRSRARMPACAPRACPPMPATMASYVVRGITAPSRRTASACTARTRSRRTQLSRPSLSHGPVPMEIQSRSPSCSLLDSISATSRPSSARPTTATGRSLPTWAFSSNATHVQTISPGSASRSSSGLYSQRIGPV